MIFVVFVTYLLFISVLSMRQSISIKWYYINFVLLICFIGLRGFDTGSLDTLDYINLLLNRGGKYSGENIEFGFMSYIYLLRPYVKNGTLFLLISTALSLAPIFYLIRKYSPNKHVSLLGFFLVVSVYIMYFVCMRQVLGMALELTAIAFALSNSRRKWYIFAALSIAAFSVHNTAVIIAIMFLLLFFINIKRYIYIGLVVGSLLCCAFNVFEDFAIIGSLLIDSLAGESSGAFSRINHYLEVDFDASSSVRLLSHVTLSVICLCHALVLNEKRYNSIFTKLYMVGVVVNNMFYAFPEVYRTSGLFDVFGLVSIGFLAESFMHKDYDIWCKKSYKKALKTVVASFVLYAYYSFSANCMYQQNHPNAQTDATLIPYEFFWEDSY